MELWNKRLNLLNLFLSIPCSFNVCLFCGIRPSGGSSSSFQSQNVSNSLLEGRNLLWTDGLHRSTDVYGNQDHQLFPRADKFSRNALRIHFHSLSMSYTESSMGLEAIELLKLISVWEKASFWRKKQMPRSRPYKIVW